MIETEIVRAPHARKQSPPDQRRILPVPWSKAANERRNREAAWDSAGGGRSSGRWLVARAEAAANSTGPSGGQPSAAAGCPGRRFGEAKRRKTRLRRSEVRCRTGAAGGRLFHPARCGKKRNSRTRQSRPNGCPTSVSKSFGRRLRPMISGAMSCGRELATRSEPPSRRVSR